AERLLEDLALIRWPESTRIMQTEWIGRSEGADIDFDLEGRANVPFLRVFTTRPDTVFGATYMVVAPEHPLIDDVLAAPPANTDISVLATYVAEARRRADVDRMTDTREKTGVFTGVYAVNPATLERIPVWTADYVLMGYGHGAIMAVPAHDQRDFEFAQAFDLPVRDVVYPPALAAVRAFVERATDRVLESPALTVLVSEFLARCVDTDEDPSDAYRDLMDGRDVDQPGRPGPEAEAWREAIEARTGQNLRQVVRAVRRHGLTLATGRADADDGIAVNSARAGEDGVSITGLATADAKQVIIDWLEAQGLGQRRVNYRLRDWLFSRQRYWGEPFPIVFDESGHHYPVSEEHLPVRLPELADYSPIESEVPVPPLSKATEWVNTTAGAAGVDPEVLPPDRPVRRETNTMPGWAGSCWYYLRFCDPHNEQRFVGEDAERYWMVSERTSGKAHAGGVDLYVGGAEHAVLHLLYARFWHKLLFDLGHVSTPEPAGRLFHQGLIQSFAYQRPDKTLVPMDEVEERADGQWFERGTDTPLVQVVAKMSKSLKNVINPDDVIAEFGADTFRLYEMYMGPLDASKPWNTRDIAGPFRFLQRFWRMCVDEQSGAVQTAEAADDAVERQLHRTIQRVGSDIERLAMNTAIAAMIEFVNLVSASGRQLTRDQMSRAVRVLAPFAPHMAEEIWLRLGEEGFVSHADWPAYDDRMLVDDTIEIPVQVNGKLRSRITVAAETGEDDLRSRALEDARIAEQIAGKTVRKVIVVPGRLVNVLVG
ncbi:MAG: class I tRNA ligase family protein, partial [Phycisphaerales bacterium]|nr:class I tRNA ligase family protein [Phycisphaerales bacterium]